MNTLSCHYYYMYAARVYLVPPPLSILVCYPNAASDYQSLPKSAAPEGQLLVPGSNLTEV